MFVCVEQVFTNAIDSLSDDDKSLPQIEAVFPLLRRGIGMHHGGLLPIIKEVIEILFQESLLKVCCFGCSERFVLLPMVHAGRHGLFHRA